MRPALLALLAVAACAHTPARIQWTDWPQDLAPGVARVYTRNELLIDAPPAVVFAWLVRVQRWPEFYGNAKHIEVESGGPDLQQGTRFRWETFGHVSTSTVRVFEPPGRIAWDAESAGLRAFHTWTLVAEGAGTRVVTEETRVSSDPALDVVQVKAAAELAHQQWLEGLARVAADGRPMGP